MRFMGSSCVYLQLHIQVRLPRTIFSLPCSAEPCHRRYFQSQGLFTVPTKIILVIAPINAFLNWFFGTQSARLPKKCLLLKLVRTSSSSRTWLSRGADRDIALPQSCVACIYRVCLPLRPTYSVGPSRRWRMERVGSTRSAWCSGNW